jgi:general secretion pathway protein G
MKHGIRAGFTLVEVLVVIVVIGLLATLVAPNVLRHLGTSKSATARSQVELLAAALDTYRLDNGSYPSTEQGLNALWREPLMEPRPNNWRGPYVRKAVPADPWGHSFVYREPATESPLGFDLLSYGKDGRMGGADENADVKGWE